MEKFLRMDSKPQPMEGKHIRQQACHISRCLRITEVYTPGSRRKRPSMGIKENVGEPPRHPGGGWSVSLYVSHLNRSGSWAGTNCLGRRYGLGCLANDGWPRRWVETSKLTNKCPHAGPFPQNSLPLPQLQSLRSCPTFHLKLHQQTSIPSHRSSHPSQWPLPSAWLPPRWPLWPLRAPSRSLAQ
jgi:hypothetical protein